ncbi:MAG: hypothetical protein ACOC4G_13200 [Bacillota bacterium]
MYLILSFLGFLLITTVYVLYKVKKKKKSKYEIVKNIRFGLFEKK